jgi:hypothetical protein
VFLWFSLEANPRPAPQARLFRFSSSVGTLTDVQPHTGYRLTKPHIGWMLFENDVQTYL